LKQISYILIVIAYCVVSCGTDTNKKTKTAIEIIPEKQAFTVLIDTFNLKSITAQASHLEVAHYFPLYIGKWKDTIYLDYFILPGTVSPPPPEPPITNTSIKQPKIFIPYFDHEKSWTREEFRHYVYEWEAEINFKRWDSAVIEIVVDTSVIVRNIDLIEINDSLFVKNAYPVFLTNKSNDTIQIGYGPFIPLIMEAKDSTGMWRPIERRYFFGCGNGVTTTILPPSEIVLTSAIFYAGNYKTELRLKIGNNYSASFNGTINQTQFERIKY